MAEPCEHSRRYYFGLNGVPEVAEKDALISWCGTCGQMKFRAMTQIYFTVIDNMQSVALRTMHPEFKQELDKTVKFINPD